MLLWVHLGPLHLSTGSGQNPTWDFALNRVENPITICSQFLKIQTALLLLLLLVLLMLIILQQGRH